MKPLARYAAVGGYLELSQAVGIAEPARLMRSVGLDPAGLSVQDRWVPAAAIARLLERSAELSGHQDFGLLLAGRRRFSQLGPLSLVIREEPDVRSALGVLTRYQSVYNESLRMRLSEVNELATVRVGIELGEPIYPRQSIELVVGVLHRLLVGFLNPVWRPVAVCFAHGAPTDRGPHRRFFGPAAQFEREFNGIVLYASDLDAPNKMADPLLRSYAQPLLDSLEIPDDAPILRRVRELIELLLPAGRCSIEQVARSLGVDRRTVHRRLAANGETFSSVLNSTRSELAERMVANRRYSLTEIAELLSFSSPGNFSRWFRDQFGCSPSQWRSQRQ